MTSFLVFSLLVQIACVVSNGDVYINLPREEFNRMKTDLENMKQEIAELKDKVGHIEWTNSSAWSQNKRRRQLLRSDQVAFDARLSHPQDHTGSEQTIVFDTVLTNVGNAYDANLGIFEAPLTGTYVFSWTISSDYASFIQTKLRVNGNIAAAMETDTGMTRTFYGSTTKVTVLNLNSQDRVYVTITDNRGSIVSTSFTHSSFEGFLLYSALDE